MEVYVEIGGRTRAVADCRVERNANEGYIKKCFGFCETLDMLQVGEGVYAVETPLFFGVSTELSWYLERSNEKVR